MLSNAFPVTFHSQSLGRKFPHFPFRIVPGDPFKSERLPIFVDFTEIGIPRYHEKEPPKEEEKKVAAKLF